MMQNLKSVIKHINISLFKIDVSYSTVQVYIETFATKLQLMTYRAELDFSHNPAFVFNYCA